jgi:hypothetical protein
MNKELVIKSAKKILLPILILLIIAFSVQYAWYKRTDLPPISELDENIKSNPKSLDSLLSLSLNDGLFDRHIHWFSGGDSGWLDPVRDKVDSNKLDIIFCDEQLEILTKTIGYNDTLINMGVNPDWFKAQNKELSWYLERLKRTREYLIRQ